MEPTSEKTGDTQTTRLSRAGFRLEAGGLGREDHTHPGGRGERVTLDVIYV